MESTTSTSVDDAVEKALLSLLAASSIPSTSASSTPDATSSSRQLLESHLHGPPGVVNSLLHRIWLPPPPTPSPPLHSPTSVRGDDAVSILSHLVEKYPAAYMALTSQAVREDTERRFASAPVDSADVPTTASDALLVALAKLLIAPNVDDKVRIATNANDALLTLCRWDHQYNCGKGLVAKRLFAALHLVWRHIQSQEKREWSAAQIRIASLMIDVALLGEEQFSWAVTADDDSGCIMDMLLHLALDVPNDDPLLQMSALDQLERLACEPMHRRRAEFLLGNDILSRGLLCLVGSNGDLTTDASVTDEWTEMDPVNGAAALRLLTEISRVGVSTSLSLSLLEESIVTKFQLLLKNFHKALQQFHPQGELERLSYIHAVSSLFATCSIGACSTPNNESAATTTELTNTILRDKSLLHDWLSLHSRAAQPKLKSAVLCSMAQVMEPTEWNDDSAKVKRGSTDTAKACTRPNDAIVLQLYQAFSEANGHRDPTELLLTSAKSPFVEERLGAYTVLKALVMRGAAVRLLLLYNDVDSGKNSFLEWLLNHDNESTTEGRNAKYQIVNTMLSLSGNLICGLIPEKLMRELELWNERGPQFRRTIPWEMATE
ncbi:hypothetical protein HJC23_008505 [Cyclotella cryptica]|uniref:Ataxin-10 domain-containing protein n=1 Tax=Cyclotella cryptica TaxID=29204 RepID=A0ABD3R5J1_9STRA